MFNGSYNPMMGMGYMGGNPMNYNMQNMGMGAMFGMPMNMNNMNMNCMNNVNNMNVMNNMNMNNMNNMNMNGMNNMNMNGMMGNNNSNMNMTGMNIGGNANWLQGYNSIKSGGNNTVAIDKKMTFIFMTTTGGKPPINIIIDHGTTINELITLYFKRLGQPELMERKQDICFLYNAQRIDYDCQQKVEKFFKFNSNPTILVSDLHNLIGA